MIVKEALELGGNTGANVARGKIEHGVVGIRFGSDDVGDDTYAQVLLDSNDCRDLGLWLLDLAKKIDKKTDKEAEQQ